MRLRELKQLGRGHSFQGLGERSELRAFYLMWGPEAQCPLHRPAPCKIFSSFVVHDTESWIVCWELQGLGCNTNSVELLGARACLSVFFFHLQNGAKNITVLCIWGFSFHFSPGLPLDPSSSFSLSKHLTLQVTMKITGHRWKVFEMLKQHQVLKPVYIGGGIRGSCRKRNLNLIKLTVTRGALRERWLAVCLAWPRANHGISSGMDNKNSF